MLTAQTLLLFNAASLIAVAAPGPAFLVCLQATLRGGAREGVATGAGLAVMAGLWSLGALTGLQALFAAFPFLHAALRYGGAVLVLIFAILIWRSATAPVADAPRVSKRQAFLLGFLMNLGNPKSILFAAGVLVVIFPPGLSAGEIAFVTLNHIALEAAVYATLATLMSRDAVRARYFAAKPLIARTMAVVLAALGLRLLIPT